MNLTDFINRTNPPEPWAEGENIPWDEPGFSNRMLQEHLNPEHDAASRRPDLIDEQVKWLDEKVLGGRPTRILDLGCGPGLYAVRLALLGHEVTGVDISPASLEYARRLCVDSNVSCEFVDADFRTVELEGEFGLIMQIFGELNVFRRSDAADIVSKCASALAPGGRLVLQVDRPESTRRLGKAPAVWQSRKSGLFGDDPHLYLKESFWDEDQRVATVRYWVIDARTAEVTRFAQSFAAYEAEEYKAVLRSAGLAEVELIAEYPGGLPPGDGHRWMLTGTKQS